MGALLARRSARLLSGTPAVLTGRIESAVIGPWELAFYAFGALTVLLARRHADRLRHGPRRRRRHRDADRLAAGAGDARADPGLEHDELRALGRADVHPDGRVRRSARASPAISTPPAMRSSATAAAGSRWRPSWPAARSARCAGPRSRRRRRCRASPTRRCAGTAITKASPARLVCAGGTLGILIPPSVIMVIYGIMTSTDIAKLFIAGILPGLVAIALYSFTVQYLVWRNPAAGPRGERIGLARAHTPAWQCRTRSSRCSRSSWAGSISAPSRRPRRRASAPPARSRSRSGAAR